MNSSNLKDVRSGLTNHFWCWSASSTAPTGCHMVQLVGGVRLEPLVRGLKPLGVVLLLASVVKGWDPTCSIEAH
jgi:hypothetical protein